MPVELRIERIEVFRIQMVRNNPQPFAEPLIMHDFALTEEFDGIPDIGIVAEAQDIVVRGPRFLFCCHVFVNIGNGVPGDRKRRGAERNAVCVSRINPRCMVDKIRCESGFLDFFFCQVPR